jgi:hypothetical protein
MARARLSRRRNPEPDELPYDEWIPTHGVMFHEDGAVSLMSEGVSNPGERYVVEATGHGPESPYYGFRVIDAETDRIVDEYHSRHEAQSAAERYNAQPNRGRRNPQGEFLGAMKGWEYWRFGDEVYRNREDDRAYMLPEGIPANARWAFPFWAWERESSRNYGRRRA